MESLLFYLLEDDSVKIKRFGHSLYIKADFQPKNSPGKEYTIEGLVSNNDFIVTSFKFYDAKTMIKVGEIEKTEKISDFV